MCRRFDAGLSAEQFSQYESKNAAGASENRADGETDSSELQRNQLVEAAVSTNVHGHTSRRRQAE